MRRSFLVVIVACLAALGAIEYWLRANLFEHASYSNSESVDAQLGARDSQGPWTMVFVGDSEVRWGIDPARVEEGLAAEGRRERVFNHAFDGFGVSWWGRLLPPILRTPSLASAQTVVVGVQLIDLHHLIDEIGQCGALQRPVLTSPFGIDLGVASLCGKESWDARLGERMFSPLWSVRYASAVRSAVLPAAFASSSNLRFNSRHVGPPSRGFQAHRPIAADRADYEDEFRRWKAQYQPERDFQPLPENAWADLVRREGFFDVLRTRVERAGKTLVLFALPTNPVVIDTFRRRSDYARNTELLAGWARERGVVYVDLGVQDRPDAEQFFSDMRHLSGTGAAIYSEQLGRALGRRLGRP